MTIITPPHAGALMAFVGATTPVGYRSDGGTHFIDPVAGTVIHMEAGIPATGSAGLKKLQTDVPGDELLQATESVIFGAGPAHSFSTSAQGIHPAGWFFATVTPTGNSELVAKIRTSDLTLLELMGDASSSLAAATLNSSTGVLTHMTTSFQLVPVQRGGANFLVSRNIRSAGIENEVAVLNVSTTGAPLLLCAATIAEEVAQLGPGRSGANIPVASFYCTGVKFNYAGGSPTPFALYEFKVYANSLLPGFANVYLATNECVSRQLIRSVAPTDIDATWINFTNVSNPGYDNADGNILVLVATQDAVSNQCYLVKFNHTTGALMWKRAIADGWSTIPLDLAKSNFKGTLEWFTNELGGSSFVTRINLADGSVTSTTTWNRGLSAMTQQIYDYLTASITGNAGYTESVTGPVPTYLGDYLAAHANVIPTNRWARIFTGAPYDDGNGGGGGGGISDTARSQAWSFTQDGHTFYVLNFGTTEGTFVYDATTEQWAKFSTVGYNQWNMRNGCMWGSVRIVAGSSTGVQTFELDPEAVTDEGGLAMFHAATGIISRRSRDYQSCDAVRVAASVGQIDDVTGATFYLRFSDDQGKTWSDYYPVTLTATDYDAELAWRSLGAFNAPGRVFEFTDTGGLIRIDGADMNPEEPEPTP